MKTIITDCSVMSWAYQLMLLLLNTERYLLTLMFCNLAYQFQCGNLLEKLPELTWHVHSHTIPPAKKYKAEEFWWSLLRTRSSEFPRITVFFKCDVLLKLYIFLLLFVKYFLWIHSSFKTITVKCELLIIGVNPKHISRSPELKKVVQHSLKRFVKFQTFPFLPAKFLVN